MSNFNNAMSKAEQSIKTFGKVMDSVNKEIKAVEVLFRSSPVVAFTYPLDDKFHFRWCDQRLRFSNGETEKPFIEWDMATRYSFHTELPNFIIAMTQEIEIILN